MSVSLCMVALGPGAEPSADRVRKDLAHRWPQLPRVADVEQKDSTFSFNVGDRTAVVGHMPAPIPWDDLEGPCETSWLWPDAARVMKKHVAHLIVTVMGDDDPVERAKLLTQVTTSVLATCPEAVGVYWGDATLVIPPALFTDMATEILPDGLPLYLWVDFRVGVDEGRTQGFTTGLAALGHKELETLDAADPPGDLRERFFGLAAYLLENGPVIKDGDTIGESAAERIKAVYARSAFGHEGKVMRLDYPAPPKKKGWKLW